MYIEGIVPHNDSTGTIVTQQTSVDGKLTWLSGDSVKIRVAHPIFAVYGDGDQWVEIALRCGTIHSRLRVVILPVIWLSSKTGSYGLYVVPGKNQNQDDVCYSILGQLEMRPDRPRQVPKKLLKLHCKPRG